MINKAEQRQPCSMESFRACAEPDVQQPQEREDGTEEGCVTGDRVWRCPWPDEAVLPDFRDVVVR